MILSTTTIGILAAGAGLTYKVGKKIYTEIKRDKRAELIRRIWLETLVYSKCWIGDRKEGTQKTFDLLEMKKTNYGYSAMSLLPWGMCMDDLLAKRKHLEDSLNAMIEVKKDKYVSEGEVAKLWIKIILKSPKFQFTPANMTLNEICVGVNYDGSHKVVNLDTCNQWLLVGKPGTGKSIMLACILSNLMYTGTSKKGVPLVDIYYSQISKSDCHYYSKCKHTVKIINNIKETVELVKELYNTAEKRDAKLKKLAVENIEEWNKLYGKKDFLKRKFLVIDELAFYTILTSDDNETKELKAMFWESMYGLARMGRSGGCHILSALQRAVANSMGGNGDLRSMMSVISLTTMNGKESSYVIDVPDAAKLNKREAILAGNGGDVEHFIVPTLEYGFSDLKKYVPELLAKEDFINNSNDEPNENSDNTINTTFDKQENILSCEKSEVITPTQEEMEYIRKSGFKLTLEQVRQGITTLEDSKIIEIKEKSLVNTTDRDKAILKFIESFGAITINQANSIFFNNNKSVESCRRRLKELEKKGLLQSADLKETKQKQYFNLEQKGKKLHDSYVIDFYCKLVELGAEILEFKGEHHLLQGALRPDGFVKYKYKGKTYKSFIEIEYSHYTSQFKIGQYEQHQQESKEKFNIIMAKSDKLQVKSSAIQLVHTSLNFDNFTI